MFLLVFFLSLVLREFDVEYDIFVWFVDSFFIFVRNLDFYFLDSEEFGWR